ncbi:3190_t:CDS:2 [Funneliformis mosseae]|uniref:3190_t:CDS:1 n=1 Tax=Funneliformis mosseae TaxID=27381 RepID=A0A9N9C5W6_FUNMO|nr:3190_t:CDS:2 [Funneliformis mosseae]
MSKTSDTLEAANVVNDLSGGPGDGLCFGRSCRGPFAIQCRSVVDESSAGAIPTEVAPSGYTREPEKLDGS